MKQYYGLNVHYFDLFYRKIFGNILINHILRAANYRYCKAISNYIYRSLSHFPVKYQLQDPLQSECSLLPHPAHEFIVADNSCSVASLTSTILPEKNRLSPAIG